MSGPLVVAGDVHLRRMDGPFFSWLAALAQRSLPGHLVLLGDVLDYWVDTPRAAHWAEPLRSAIDRLRAVGWRVDVIPGNREMVAGHCFANGLRLTPRWPGMAVSVAGQRIWIEHGDRLCEDSGHRGLVAILRGFWWRYTTAALPAPVHDLVARWMRRHSRGNVRSRYHGPRVRIDARELAGRRRLADTVIAGHIHRVRDWRLPGVRLLLVGDWDEHGGTWVEADGNGIRHRTWQE